MIKIRDLQEGWVLVCIMFLLLSAMVTTCQLDALEKRIEKVEQATGIAWLEAHWFSRAKLTPDQCRRLVEIVRGATNSSPTANER